MFLQEMLDKASNMNAAAKEGIKYKHEYIWSKGRYIKPPQFLFGHPK